ncbi:Guanine deaminase [Candidatus Methylomirabilis lanthanidiphila]|uniref:Guanine deaminase n=1 Tax=Candidatus Methylomirabilis lanthanidiphila TaxID=2211376 RepID=A0A564ZFI2_9BACT|nr:guanine deaminase [Candidatus Methylomirabilis lanthanidiphila]VUZ84070.1 Guanine deaminase [Candidatus Methylomirabilis lanthanidiphila]
MQPMRLFRGQILNPEAEDRYSYHTDGGIVIDGSGVILAVGDYHEVQQQYPSADPVDCSDRLILPGFIDTHTHLPQYRAVARYGNELLEWLERDIFPTEREFTPETADTLCPIFFRSLLAHGVTTAAIYCSVRKDSTHVAFQWAEQTGIRAIIGKVMMDRNAPDFLLEKTSDSLQASEEVCRAWHGAANGKLLYAFTPRFAPTCSRALMRGVSDLASQYGAYIQTHLAENLAELQWVRELFPETRSYTDVYFGTGLLGPKTLLAHAIYVSSDERRLLADTGSCLSHCPASNLFLKSGLMPLRELMDMGLRIGVGSDVASGPTLSPFEAMRSAIYTHTARRFLPDFGGGDISPTTAFYLATLGGARALRLDDKIGSLVCGKEADFIIVNPQRLSPLPTEKWVEISPDTLLSRLIFCGDDRIVEQTYVRGTLCYDRRSHDNNDR